MRTENYEVVFNSCPKCRENLYSAIQRIGELDPLNIKRSTLHSRIVKNNMNSRDFFNRGVLNLRLLLNRNLGKNGKYTNRAIKKAAKITCKQDGTDYCLKASVPGKAFAKLVASTYTLLWVVDEAYCRKLLSIEQSDVYAPRLDEMNLATNTVAPIQAATVAHSGQCSEEGTKAKQYLMQRFR